MYRSCESRAQAGLVPNLACCKSHLQLHVQLAATVGVAVCAMQAHVQQQAEPQSCGVPFLALHDSSSCHTDSMNSADDCSLQPETPFHPDKTKKNWQSKTSDKQDNVRQSYVRKT